MNSDQLIEQERECVAAGSYHNQVVAYVDCFSGVSGDMLLGALLDGGVELESLQTQLALLNLEHDLRVSEQEDNGLRAIKVTVIVPPTQPHRSWQEIRNIITESGLSDQVKSSALKIFQLLAEAEARVHGCLVEDVHFHEVGAVDSIIDIVGVAIALKLAEIDQLICSPLPLSSGWVSCQHGLLPLPPPAVCEILKNVPVYSVELRQELVTPTGAAIVKAMSSDFGGMPAMTIKKVGYGAGSRKLASRQPNLLRIIIGEQRTVAASMVEIIETNLDDCTPEIIAHVCERLFELGALDVSLTAIQMKKGRPAFLLRIISDLSHGFILKQAVLSETTAIGLRFRHEQRWVLPREAGTVKTRWGKAGVKRVETPQGAFTLYPEYENCKQLAAKWQISLKELYAEIGSCNPAEFKVQKADG